MSNDRATRASRAAMSPDSGDGHADDFAEVIYSMICIAPTVSATLAPRNARQARQGRRFLRAELPRILATPPDVLSARMVQVISDLAEDWRRAFRSLNGLEGRNLHWH